MDGDPNVTSPVATPSKPQPWTPADVRQLLDTLVPYVDRYLKLQESRNRHEVRLVAAEVAAHKSGAYLLVGFATAIIALMTWLAWQGRIGGDALLFLVGTVMGSVLMLIQRWFAKGSVIERTNDEEE